MAQKILYASWLSVGILFFKPVFSQNITSPYSILGIGDVDTKDFGRYFGSGNASLARRDLYSYNFSNPASLTSLPFKTVHFDVATRGRSAKYYLPDTDSSIGTPSSDFVVKRVTMAVKVGPKSGIAFGLRPYSSVNYRYLENEAILDGNTTYYKLVEGNGGINQFYFSYAKELSKQLSAGITASWLFGSLARTTQYLSPTISLNITKDERDFYNGAILQGGVQYYSKPGKKWRHQLGFVSSVSTNLNGELTTEYTDASGVISKEVEADRNFKLPFTAGFGYSAVRKEKMTFSLEANYYNWNYQKVNYASSYTSPSFRISSGFEYAILGKQGGQTYEKGYLSLGASLENSYLRIKKNNLWDYSFSIGLGKNVSRNISLYSGLELGNRGRLDYEQVKEQYTQFILGITIKDIWMGPKYSRRYD